jgi:hypothetical protein
MAGGTEIAMPYTDEDMTRRHAARRAQITSEGGDEST